MPLTTTTSVTTTTTGVTPSSLHLPPTEPIDITATIPGR